MHLTAEWTCWLTQLLFEQVREREAGIDQLLAPIKDMYALLVRYEVHCPWIAAASSAPCSAALMPSMQYSA